MRKIVLGVLLTLLLAPVRAQDEDDDSSFVDGPSGLKIGVPEGWDREDDREGGPLRFAAKYDVARGKYIQFEIMVSDGQDEFDWDSWLSGENANVKKLFKVIEIPFKGEKISLGGAEGARFTIAGKREGKNGAEYSFRFRRTGLLQNGLFFVLNEMSFNGAHVGQDGPLKALYDGISFQSPEGLDAEGGGGMGSGGGSSGGTSIPSGAEATTVTDKLGNWTAKFPAGWVVGSDPPEDATSFQRLTVTRENEDGERLVLLQVFRTTEGRAEVFTIETPSDFLKNIDGNGFFEAIYGNDSRGTLRHNMDEGKLLGGTEKSGQFEMESILPDEQKKIDEAETLVRRGEKGVKVPEYKPVVTRGGVALISPNGYVIRAVFLARRFAHDEKLLAEYRGIMDSFQFLSTEKMPAPLNLAGAGVNTLETQKESIKGKKIFSLPGHRLYKLEVSYLIPPGLVLSSANFGPNASIVVYGQDSRNNWVKIVFSHENAGRLSEQRLKFPPPKQSFDSWRSNWESKASGAKIPAKAQGVSLIRGLSGKGFKKLVGMIEGHRGTFTGMVKNKSGWRHQVEMETRGHGDTVFEKQIKAFFKSIKIKPIKK